MHHVQQHSLCSSATSPPHAQQSQQGMPGYASHPPGNYAWYQGYPMGQEAYAYGYDGTEYGYSQQMVPQTGLGSWFEFSNSCYLKGLFVGAGVTLLLTNPTVQKMLMRGIVKVWSTVQGGVEEVKEQFRDIKAEMSQEE